MTISTRPSAPPAPGTADTGFHFLQLPGPTNIPERVLRAMHRPATDHRGAAFAELTLGLLADLKKVFRTDQEVFILPSSGSGAGEAALVNTLSPGDGILMFDSGQFSKLWIKMARQFGLDVQVIENDWRRAPCPDEIERALIEDSGHGIKAVFVVHNETSTGVTARIPEIREAIDGALHPALLIVDTVSSLGCMDYRHDDWRVDVAVSGSQKGLMLPPGLGFCAVSEKAREASKTATLPRFYWDWEWMRENNADGFFPFTPAINLFYGLRESLDMMFAEGLQNIFARHRRLGLATRAAVDAWGFETICANHAELSDSVTAVLYPDGHDVEAFRDVAREEFGLTLGGGLARFQGRAFRIGHMGHCSELMTLATLQGVEMALHLQGLADLGDGTLAARQILASESLAAAAE
ncbi:MAG: aminotransferase class V-fold PLP-dependent enzyme [Magnetovibrio sp.]|nr:aminotransferase class V-fold PLP-dependent enzyme [Magnetovibrio sp.]